MKILSALILAVCLAWPPASGAADTTIEIGVLANGAKFIGDKTGGAYVLVVDEENDAILAEGVTHGSTGDTQRIMKGEGGRYLDITSEGDAVFRANIALLAPRKVTVKATGPLDYPGSSSSASESLWLIPGHSLVGGNRVLIDLAGFIIQPVSMSIDGKGQGHVRVDLQMLCGCPITPGGTWNAEQLIKQARLITADGKESEPVALQYTGDGTVYEARFENAFDKPQSVRVDVVSMNNANTGSLDVPLQL